MQPEPKPPLSLVAARHLLWAAAWLVPRAARDEWRKEWEAEIWHRWRFLEDAGAWSHEEGLRLLLCCSGAIPDAAWHLSRQEAVRERVRESARSPWLCLGLLFIPLFLLTIFTGLPATRQLLMPLPYRNGNELSIISLRSEVSGKESGVRTSMLPDWAQQSRLLAAGQSIAPFNWMELKTDFPDASIKPLLITVEPNFFHVLGVDLAHGEIPKAPAIVLSHRAWVSLFYSSPDMVGGTVTIQGQIYRIAGILPDRFWFLSRRPALFFVMPHLPDNRVMVVARAKPGIRASALENELVSICRKNGYSVSRSAPHVISITESRLAPVFFFNIAMLGGLVCLARLANLRTVFRRDLRVAAVWRRSAFFAAKCAIALSVVFCAGLEVSRTESSILLPRMDSASGPGLAWIYLLASMAVLFWAWADQRARCRVCLRLLCFPVRIGCPGCLLLDWAGTELLCSEGHGVLHVPDMVASWDNESDHWIALDESWRDCFSHAE